MDYSRLLIQTRIEVGFANCVSDLVPPSSKEGHPSRRLTYTTIARLQININRDLSIFI